MLHFEFAAGVAMAPVWPVALCFSGRLSNRQFNMKCSTCIQRSTLLALVFLAMTSGCRDDGSGSIIISEFMASNGNGLKDADGETSDWIELANTGNQPVNLKGFRLTDDPSEPMRWVFSDVTIAPGQYLVVFASGKGTEGGDSELHTNFRMKASPDFLALLRPNGRALTQFKPYPEQKSDVSYGLGSDGVVGFLQTPTPGAPNSASVGKKKDKADSKHKSDNGEHKKGEHKNGEHKKKDD